MKLALLLSLLLGACSAGAPHPRDALSVSLERALRRNPNQEATSAHCRPETRAELRRAPFGHTRRPVLRCSIAWGGVGPEAYDVQVLAGGCFVGERVRRGRADMGCGALSSAPG